MSLTDFSGLDGKVARLLRLAQAGRIVHALLFCGPHGTGKRSVARELAKTLLCRAPGERPCGRCPACKRVEAETHPDVHVVGPSAKSSAEKSAKGTNSDARMEKKNTIRVEQIRALTEKLSLTSYEGGMKIAIIEQADRMNESAQNALLKTLEEPSGDTLFVLLTDATGALLPTIVSRCLQLRFSCLEPEVCARVLERRGMPGERAKLLAELSQGSVGRALEIDADASYLPLRERVLAALGELSRPDGVALATAKIGDVKGRESDVLEILEQRARELMRAQNSLTGQEARNTPVLRGSFMLQRVMLARKQLKSNLNWVNALESMNFALAEQIQQSDG